MSTAAISWPPLLRLRPLDYAHDQRSSYRLSLKGKNLGFSLKTATPMTKKFELNCSAEMARDLSTSPLAEGTVDWLDDFPPAELELKRRETSIATVLTNIRDSFDPYGAMSTPLYKTSTFNQAPNESLLCRMVHHPHPFCRKVLHHIQDHENQSMQC